MGGTGTEAIRLATFFIKSDTLSVAHALVDEGVLRQQLWFAPQKPRHNRFYRALCKNTTVYVEADWLRV